jgi:PPOX class probable F420-dependent enzyme
MPKKLEDSRYINLSTYRRSGVAVETPVWFAEDGGRLYVFSAGNAGKVKRLRNSSRARIAACDMRGGLEGDWQDADAVIVKDPAEIDRAHSALRRKYGWQLTLTDFLSRLSGRIHHRAFIAVTLRD